MNFAWRGIEYFPKADKYKEWPDRKSVLGYYIPDCEPRLIPEGALHPPIRARQDRAGPHLQAGEHPEELPGRPAAGPRRLPGRLTMPRMTTGREAELFPLTTSCTG